jgi:cbb3-type cytochrome oxidase cytochrome c subunit/predicted DNA-binding protein (UPF0251 family)
MARPEGCRQRAFRLAALLCGDEALAGAVLRAIVRGAHDLTALDGVHLDRLTLLRTRETAPTCRPIPGIDPTASEALAALPAQQREAWVLVHVYGVGDRDAARTMDCSNTAFRRHLEQAEDTMRPAVGDHEAAVVEGLIAYTLALQPPKVKGRRWPRKFPIKQILGVIVLILIVAALVFIVWRARKAMGAEPVRPDAHKARAGTTARLRGDGVVIQRTMPAMNWSLPEGAGLDYRLPADAITGRFDVGIASTEVRRARLGIQLHNARVRIGMGESVLLSAEAGDEPVEAFAVDWAGFTGRDDHVWFEVERTGSRAHAVRAVWRPEGAPMAERLPSDGAALLAEPAIRGMERFQSLGCGACHLADDETRDALLNCARGPDLGGIGTVVRAQWLRALLEDPYGLKPDSTMPEIVLNDRDLDDLVHFLRSLEGEPNSSTAVNDAMATEGRVLYHESGCAACHGVIDEDHPQAGALWREYTTLGRVGMKYRTEADLAKFIETPEARWSAGRMPSMGLAGDEACSIAAHLLTIDDAGADVDGDAEPVDLLKANAGSFVFRTAGCADCHRMGPGSISISSQLKAPDLAEIALSESDGCIGENAESGAPHYRPPEHERAELRAFLDQLRTWRTTQAPVDELVVAMERLQCVRCHAFHAGRGPERGLRPVFRSSDDETLGWEGRLPPNLTDVGGRLTADWIRSVLLDGARFRPFMRTRMPQYPAERVERLPDLFRAAAGATSLVQAAPAFDAEQAERGRAIVDTPPTDCRRCHLVSGDGAREAPGVELAVMARRMHYPAFARWMRDPEHVRPGARMPRLFMHDGAEADIEAVWMYLERLAATTDETPGAGG